MYIDFFGLHEKPFNVTPDPSFLYFSKEHQEALANLTYGVNERKGFIAVTGEIGAGKTTLCRALLDKIRKNVRTAYLLNSNITSDMQFLQMIIDDFGIKPSGKNKAALLKAMNDFLIEQTMLGNNVVIIIDEAQNLRPRVLEQIRMLSNLETDKEKLLQIIFVGQPELRDILNSPKLIQLNQRITVRCHISALDKEDLINYINHRLSVAGSTGFPVFSHKAIDEIYKFSGGIPRLINIICDRTLLLAFVLERKDISDEMVRQSISEVRDLQYA